MATASAGFPSKSSSGALEGVVCSLVRGVVVVLIVVVVVLAVDVVVGAEVVVKIGGWLVGSGGP